MKYKAVIFDLDGVICSTDEYHYRAWKKTADALGIPFDRRRNDLLRGVSRRESLEIILEAGNADLSESEKQFLLDRKNACYLNFLREMSPASLDPQVLKTMENLREAGLLLAIGSSSENAPFILQQIGLEDYFDAVADGNSCKKAKPAPDIFLSAAEMLAVPASECLVVEDVAAGVKAARAAGMEVAGLGDAARKKAADFNLTAFSEIENLIFK